MYTALRATSLTLSEFLRQRFIADPILGGFFGGGGAMVVSLSTPIEMSETENPAQGLSVWLYQVVRDDQRLNAPQERIDRRQSRRTPLPVRLHYLMTPIIVSQPETEQIIIGKVLQVFHDHPRLHGTDLKGELGGTSVELYVRLESLNLEEITRVWEGLEGSYQLSVSYEVTVVYIESEREPDDTVPVEVVLPEYGLIVSAEVS